MGRDPIETAIDDARARHALRAQQLFREVNGEIENVNRGFAALTGTYALLCECGRTDCVEMIAVPVEEYRSIRAEDDLFVVVDGHERETLERVVERRRGYTVVRLRGR